MRPACVGGITAAAVYLVGDRLLRGVAFCVGVEREALGV